MKPLKRGNEVILWDDSSNKWTSYHRNPWTKKTDSSVLGPSDALWHEDGNTYGPTSGELYYKTLIFHGFKEVEEPPEAVPSVFG